MDGAKVKNILLSNGFQLNEVAEIIGITPQDLQSKLRSKDLKSSFLVELSNAINKSVYFFLNSAEIKPKVQEKYPNHLGTSLGTQMGTNEKCKKSTQNKDEEREIKIREKYIPSLKKLKYNNSIILSNTGAPFYKKPVSAGELSLEYEQLNNNNEINGFIDLPEISCKGYFPVVGFSFKPLIMPGDVIGVTNINSWERIDPDCIYFIITVHERMIKYLQNDPKDDSVFICSSPNIKDFTLPKNEIKEIYKIIFYGRLA